MQLNIKLLPVASALLLVVAPLAPAQLKPAVTAEPTTPLASTFHDPRSGVTFHALIRLTGESF